MEDPRRGRRERRQILVRRAQPERIPHARYVCSDGDSIDQREPGWSLDDPFARDRIRAVGRGFGYDPGRPAERLNCRNRIPDERLGRQPERGHDVEDGRSCTRRTRDARPQGADSRARCAGETIAAVRASRNVIGSDGDQSTQPKSSGP